MPLTFVHHDTTSPARDAMLAGVIAAQTGAEFLCLDTGGAGLGAYEACQHVLASGALAANGLFWSEWASGHPVPPALPPAVIARRLDAAVLVPVNPAVPAQVEMAERLDRKPHVREAVLARLARVRSHTYGWQDPCRRGFQTWVRPASTRVMRARPLRPSRLPSRVTSSSPPAPPPTTTM